MRYNRSIHNKKITFITYLINRTQFCVRNEKKKNRTNFTIFCFHLPELLYFIQQFNTELKQKNNKNHAIY